MADQRVVSFKFTEITVPQGLSPTWASPPSPTRKPLPLPDTVIPISLWSRLL